MTKGSNFIIVKFSESTFRQKNHVAGIYAAGADKNAFSAKHAFINVFPGKIIFSSVYQDVKFSETESGKIPSRT